MTIITTTPEYLVEFEAGILTIARYSDGHCIALKGHGLSGQFREALKKHGKDRTIRTYLKIDPKATWQPLYKPDRMPRDAQ